MCWRFSYIPKFSFLFLKTISLFIQLDSGTSWPGSFPVFKSHWQSFAFAQPVFPWNWWLIFPREVSRWLQRTCWLRFSRTIVFFFSSLLSSVYPAILWGWPFRRLSFGFIRPAVWVPTVITAIFVFFIVTTGLWLSFSWPTVIFWAFPAILPYCAPFAYGTACFTCTVLSWNLCCWMSYQGLVQPCRIEIV